MDQLKCEIIKEEVPLPDFFFKVIIIGEAGVGKSCILYRATTGEFKETYEVTIGAGFSSFSVKINDSTVKLQIWDTAGQENFRSMIRVFYKGSNAAIIVYDVNRKETFAKIEEWLYEVKENARTDAKLVLVGNKKDKETDRQIDTTLGKALAEKHGIDHFLETSAKTGEGIENLFLTIAKELYMENAGIVNPDKSGGSKLKSGTNKRQGCC